MTKLSFFHQVRSGNVLDIHAPLSPVTCINLPHCIHDMTKIKCSLKMCMWLQVNGHHPVENMMRNICILVPLLLLLPPVKLTDLRALTFIYYNIEKSWADAQAFCRENHTDLITIRNATENLASIHGWLGLYRDDSTSEWKWSRGDERANFTTWRDGKSQKLCVKWATPCI